VGVHGSARGRQHHQHPVGVGFAQRGAGDAGAPHQGIQGVGERAFGRFRAREDGGHIQQALELFDTLEGVNVTTGVATKEPREHAAVVSFSLAPR
jgi:hypothetical protein